MTAARVANFDRVARLYRWAEYLLLGPLLQRTRTALLPALWQARHALVLGDGDGRFLACLLRQNPHLHAVAVDSSASMLRLLERRCRFAGARLQTRQGLVDAAQLPIPAGNFDLVVTHFFLDCLPQAAVEAVARELARRLPPGALWLISDFAYPAHQPWRFLGRLYVRLLYRVFRLLTSLPAADLPCSASALTSAGFRLQQRRSFVKGLLYSEIWQLARPHTAAVSGPRYPTPSTSSRNFRPPAVIHT